MPHYSRCSALRQRRVNFPSISQAHCVLSFTQGDVADIFISAVVILPSRQLMLISVVVLKPLFSEQLIFRYQISAKIERQIFCGVIIYSLCYYVGFVKA